MNPVYTSSLFATGKAQALPMKTAEQHNAALVGFIKDFGGIETIRRQKNGGRFGKQRPQKRKRR